MKLRHKDVTDIAQALKALDNTKDNGYKFKGTVRTAIARKMRAAVECAQDLDKHVADLRMEAGLGKTRVDSKGDTVSADDPQTVQKFVEAHRAYMNEEVELEIGKFVEDDLDLDNNQIPGSVIAALMPIITFKADK